MAEIRALLDGASPDYFQNPGKHTIDLPLSAPESGTYEAELCRVLTLVFHAISQERGGLKRTGKPEDPIKVSFKITEAAYAESCEAVASYMEKEDQGPIYHLYASDFWQRQSSVSDLFWPKEIAPQRMVVSSDGKRHPARLRKPAQGTILYQRFSPSFNTQFTLKVADLDENLQDFHNWHNSDRVNAFWGERGTLEAHSAYLTRQLQDPHVIPTIAYFGPTAFAYFELYHASEDAIAPFSNATPFDRGFHALVGNDAFRGPDRVKFWISCVSHYLFLSDPRTQRVMLEPRVDNDKFIGYLVRSGYVVEKEFNFPHKRAALVSISREKFFECHGVAT